MDEEIRNLLEEEIKAEINGLSTLNLGSDERSDAIDDLAALYKLRMEEIKIEMDSQERILKRDQLDEQIKDRYFRFGIAAAEIIIPLIFYAAWMRRGFKFEETGTFTSATFRGLFNRFRPTKK